MKPGGSPLTPSPAVGLILSFVALFLALFPTGAGHGWAGPLLVSLALPFVYPAAMARARGDSRKGLPIDLALVAVAIAADVFLCLDLVQRAREWLPKPRDVLPGVDRSVFPIFLLWLALWLHWQFVAARTALRHIKSAQSEADCRGTD